MKTLLLRATVITQNRLHRAKTRPDDGGLSLEWLLVVGFLVAAAVVVAARYGNRIDELLDNLGGAPAA